MSPFAKFFTFMYVPLAAVLFITFFVSNSMMLSSAQGELLEDLSAKWQIVRHLDITDTFDAELQEQFLDITRKTKTRITLITPDGRVRMDSYFNRDELTDLENHGNRPEVVAAFSSGAGHDIRLSGSTDIRMIYYARVLDNGVILRLAAPMNRIEELKDEFLRGNVVLFFSLFLLTAAISAVLARQFTQPISRLNRVVEQIEAGRSRVHFPIFQDATMSRIASIIYRIYKAMHAESEKLLAERVKLDHILAIMDEGIVFLNENNAILHFNRKAEEYLDITLSGKENLIRDIDDYDALSFFREVLVESGEFRGRVPLKERMFEVYVRVAPHEKLIVFSDITDRTRYEAFKTELVGNISHELKTPLSMIMGYAETLLSTPDIPPEMRERFLNGIFSGTQRLDNLINDILELHRLESVGDAFTVSEPVDVSEVLDTVSTSIVPRDDKVVEYENDVSTAWVLHEHLASILTNFIDNAMKYSTGRTIRVKVSRESGVLVVSVADEGPAIPSDRRERVFERFYTVSKSRNRMRSGTGLGLSIVKHIAQVYNGTVRLTQNRYGGNTFEVTLREEPNEGY